MAFTGAEIMNFEDAKAKYVHRFTMEHVPAWAILAPANTGKYYAPQYVSDKEWFDNTVFPPNSPYGPWCSDCFSTNASWPLGQWLDKPYKAKAK